MTTATPSPLAYSLERTAAGTWKAHVQGLPLSHPLDGTTALPSDIETGGEAHAYMQARLPGARYMSPDQKRGRKYRGAYPSKIRELFAAGSLWVATCNNGARYSIPAGSGLPVPALGHCVLAFERTDWTGETYGPETDTTGTCLPAREREALEALYLDNRPDPLSPVDAANRVQGRAFVTCARYNRFNVRDASGAVIATRATLYGPNGAQIVAETMNRRAAETATAETERLERLERNRADRTRRDNVEYHAGRAARVAGEALEACPYLEGGERAARWTLGWNEAPAPLEGLDAIAAALEALDADLRALASTRGSHSVQAIERRDSFRETVRSILQARTAA